MPGQRRAVQLRGLGSVGAGFGSARDAELKPGLGSAVVGFSSARDTR